MFLAAGKSFECGGQGRNRTADASLFRAALYRLSYLAVRAERLILPDQLFITVKITVKPNYGCRDQTENLRRDGLICPILIYSGVSASVMGEKRLGDVIDDHCIKCRRITNHSIVSLLNGEAAKVRCRTCYHDHDYRHEQAPPSKKDLKKAEEAQAALAAQNGPQPESDSEAEPDLKSKGGHA